MRHEYWRKHSGKGANEMKGRIILYGWLLSWVLLLLGLGTMEWAMETGDPVFLEGFLMSLSFAIFSFLVIHNPKDTDKAVEEFDRWFDRIFGDKG